MIHKYSGMHQLIKLHDQCQKIDDRAVHIRQGQAVPVDSARCSGFLVTRLNQKNNNVQQKVSDIVRQCYRTEHLEDKYTDIMPKLPDNTEITGREISVALDAVVSHLSESIGRRIISKDVRGIRKDIAQKVENTVNFETLQGIGGLITDEHIDKYQQILLSKLEQRCLFDPNNIHYPSDHEIQSVWTKIYDKVRDGNSLVQSKLGLTALDKCFIIRDALDTAKFCNTAMLEAVCSCMPEAKQFIAATLHSTSDNVAAKAALTQFQNALNSAIYHPGDFGRLKDGIPGVDEADLIISIIIKAAMQSVMLGSDTTCINYRVIQKINASGSWCSAFLKAAEEVFAKDETDGTPSVFLASAHTSAAAHIKQHFDIQGIKIANEVLLAAEELEI